MRCTPTNSPTWSFFTRGGVTPTAPRPARIANEELSLGRRGEDVAADAEDERRAREVHPGVPHRWISPLRKPACLVSARPRRHDRESGSFQSSARPPACESTGAASSAATTSCDTVPPARGDLTVLPGEAVSEAAEDSPDAHRRRHTKAAIRIHAPNGAEDTHRALRPGHRRSSGKPRRRTAPGRAPRDGTRARQRPCWRRRVVFGA